MRDFDKIIKNELVKMEDNNDIAFFRSNIEEMLKKVIEFTEKKYNDIELRMAETVKDLGRNFVIYNLAVKNNEAKIYSGSLYPIVNNPGSDLFNKNGNGEITGAFGMLSLSECEIEKIIQSRRLFSGYINSGGGQKAVKARLEKDKRYISKENELKNLFFENGVGWKNINAPYNKKMVTVILEECEKEIEIPDGAEVIIDFEEYSQNWHKDYVGMWNIEIVGEIPAFGAVKNNDSIKKEEKTRLITELPVIDIYNYEYKFEIKESSAGTMYSCTGGKIIDRYARGNEMIVIGDSKEMADWKMYLFRDVAKDGIETEFPITSNREVESIMSDLGNYFGRRMKTPGEFEKTASGFETVNEWITICGIKNLNEVWGKEEKYGIFQKTTGENYLAADSENVVFKYSVKKEDFLTGDMIRFLTDELERRYPEYLFYGEAE